MSARQTQRSDLSWTQAFVGLPYADRGRGPDGWDCWGLVRLVYADRLGIVLPSYDELYTSSIERTEIAAIVAQEAAASSWKSVQGEPAELDVLWFRRGRHDAHCGIYLRQGLMLHMASRDCAKIESLDDPRLAVRLTGIYRWSGAA